MQSSGKLILVPCGLGELSPDEYLSSSVLNIIRNLKFWIVENEKSARAFLKACQINLPQSDLIIFQLEKHSPAEGIDDMLKVCIEGNDIALLSEAGLPAVADPGALVVRQAQKLNIYIEPLTGPSSLMLALMASGLNGQQFRFNGYLPVEKDARMKAIRQLEKEAKQKNETQIFIETPYRNNAMISDLLNQLSHETQLCVALGIHTSKQSIKTMSVSEWKRKVPDLNKTPCVFLLL